MVTTKMKKMIVSTIPAIAPVPNPPSGISVLPACVEEEVGGDRLLDVSAEETHTTDQLGPIKCND